MSDDKKKDANKLEGDEAEKPTTAASEEHIALQTPTAVDIHPLILLSVVDHYARMNAKVQQNRRVVGLLLGSYKKNPRDASKGTVLDINNCFGVPFDEDPKDPAVWFFDTNYADEMYKMYKKVLPKVRIVGWYTSGTEISQNDLNIHLLVAQRFCPNPVCCIVNTEPTNKGVPLLAYTTTGSLDGRDVEFRTILSELSSYEAEDIGIEHLLRDLTDSTVTTLSSKVGDRQLALSKLDLLLRMIEEYLIDVADGKLPMNHQLMGNIQELMDLLPLVHQVKTSEGMLVAANDEQLATFVASVGRTVMALYDVILNRRKLASELKANQAKKKEADEKEKAEKEKKEKETQEAEAKKKADTEASAEKK
jgi:26S proteasome regulatory subunit N8